MDLEANEGDDFVRHTPTPKSDAAGASSPARPPKLRPRLYPNGQEEKEELEAKSGRKAAKREHRLARQAAAKQLRDLHSLTHLPADPASCEGCALGKMRKSPSPAVTKSRKMEDPDPPKA